MEYRSVDEYSALIDQSTDIITLLDEEGIIQFVNPPVERILGFRPDEIIGELAFDLVHPDERERLMEVFGRIVNAPGESTEKQEHRFLHADGSYVWTESITTNRTGSNLDGYVINSRDISERKCYKENLEESNKKLEALNRIIRHDIRNDMNIILNWGEMLEDHVDDAGYEHLQKILASVDHVVELTDTASDYTKTLTSDATIQSKPVPLRSTVQTELSLRREFFPAAEFVVNGEIPDVSVTANEMLGSVFRNLLNNAVQHNDAAEPVVEITCEREDESVTVRIADNGSGIPPEQEAMVFAEGEKGLTSQGSGIGLYLVKRLIDQYGGAIWTEDNDPTGTVFAVELSIAET